MNSFRNSNNVKYKSNIKITNKIFNKHIKINKKKKLTCLIFGGLGNQLTMSSIANIFSQEKGIKEIDFEYINPSIGALRSCLLKNYYLSKNINIKYANSLLQKIYKVLVKFGFLRKYFFIWKGMKISILDLPFKLQMEINELEFEILCVQRYKKQILTNVSLINKQLLSSLKYNIVIHFRDYLDEMGSEGEKYQLKESYFINAMRILKLPNGSNITVICYKKPINRFPKLSSEYKLDFLTNSSCGVEKSLEIMRNSDNLIMSNSTLSWWGAFGMEEKINSRKIVFPLKYSEGLINWRPSYKLNNWIPCDE